MCRVPALWTHGEAAAYLRVEEDLLHHLVVVGRGPRLFWVGRHRRYESTGVRAWLMTQERPMAPRRSPRHAAGTPALTSPAAGGTR